MNRKSQIISEKLIPGHCTQFIVGEEPNERLKIHTGEFTIKNDSESYQLVGEIYFNWIPHLGVRFKGEVVTASRMELRLLEDFEILVKDIVCGKATLLDIEFTDEKKACGGSVKNFIWGDKSVQVSEIHFAIANMREYHGSEIKGKSTYKGRLLLDNDLYQITIDRLYDFKLRKEKLDDKSGYLILYRGKILKKRNRSITHSEFEKLNLCLSHFLYFLNGRRVSPLFLTGRHDGKNVWRDYSSSDTEPYKYTYSWSNNVLMLDDLSVIWRSFNRLWEDDMNRDFLITIIHWYVEANSNSARIEGSIILVQAALELLYNWLIVEQQKLITGKDAESISAANKIRLLISKFKIGFEIPSSLAELSKIENVQDAPEAFVKIRNGLVHGQEIKRRELMKIELMAKFEALHLGIWYVELALLYILGYEGIYCNRIHAKVGRYGNELMPWLKSEARH